MEDIYCFPSSDKILTNHILRFYVKNLLVDGIILKLTQEMQLHDRDNVFSGISSISFYSMLKVAKFDFIPLVYILFQFNSKFSFLVYDFYL